MDTRAERKGRESKASQGRKTLHSEIRVGGTEAHGSIKLLLPSMVSHMLNGNNLPDPEFEVPRQGTLLKKVGW